MLVSRRPNCSSMTTTSPRAIGVPLTSTSTGSSAMRSSVITEPSRSSSVSPTVIRVRPTSTDRSIGTADSRRRSEFARGSVLSSFSWGRSRSGSSLLLLDREVGEVDLRDLHVGLRLMPCRIFFWRAAPRRRQQDLGRLVRDVVGDDRADDRLLHERAVAGRVVASALRGRPLLWPGARATPRSWSRTCRR